MISREPQAGVKPGIAVDAIARRRACPLALGVIALIGLGSCSGGSDGRSTGERARPVAAAEIATTECGTYSGRGCAPRSARVDLRPPTFSNPTRVTNPLNPISSLRSAILLGHEGRQSFRSETTLLPGTTTVAWGGQRIRALVSQYIAWRDGQISEAALDRYAQADDGSVWYLGEDVFDYERGAIATTEGTWLAGREGPGAMIMPAHPRSGDTYRTENVPGIVFEEVTVKTVGRTVDGPHGPVHGAIVAQELHLDRTREEKLFAPGYGEFRTSGGGSLEALALAVPTDALAGAEPPALRRLSTATSGILGSAQAEDWSAADATLRRIVTDAEQLRAANPPPLIADELSAAVRQLGRAVRSREPVSAGLAATDVHQAGLDLALQYRPPAEVDRLRMELWASRLLLHAAARDHGRVAGDVATMEWISDRFKTTLGKQSRSELEKRLRDVRVASDAKNLRAAADHAARLAAALRQVS